MEQQKSHKQQSKDAAKALRLHARALKLCGGFVDLQDEKEKNYRRAQLDVFVCKAYMPYCRDTSGEDYEARVARLARFKVYAKEAKNLLKDSK